MKIGVVMSGRGLQGLLNLAIVEWLVQSHLPVTHVVATGTGAIIGALWGMQHPIHTLEPILTHQVLQLFRGQPDWYTLLTFFVAPFRRFNIRHALFKPNRPLRWLERNFQDIRIEQLSPSTSLIATHVARGTSVQLDHGPLAPAVYAASSLLPFYPPICIDQQWLNDGSFTDPLPIMPLIQQHVDVIFALQFEHTAPATPTFLSRYSHFIGKAIPKSQRSRVAMALELHKDEIFFIKVKLEHASLDTPQAFQSALDTTRHAIASYQHNIWQTLGHHPTEQST